MIILINGNNRTSYPTPDDFMNQAKEDMIYNLAETMSDITLTCSDDKRNIYGLGVDIISEYFGQVPEDIRSEVFLEYIEMLEERGFDVEAVKKQAAA